MPEAATTCTRCKGQSQQLAPLPGFIRLLALPAMFIFPPLKGISKYCPKCRRAMTAPVLVLVGIAYAILYLIVRRWLS